MTQRILQILRDEEGKGGGGGGTPAPLFETIIPQEFKDKPYLADIKTLPVTPESYAALFKKLDGAQTLIGKKTGAQPPAADAPAEEMEKFYSALRPAKAEDYEFPKPAEGQTVDEDFVKAARGMFHNAGLSKAQVAKLIPQFDKYVAEKSAPILAENARLDAEFKELMGKTFGPENGAVLERSKALLTQLTPDGLKPHLVKLPNEALVVLAGVMESVRAKFMAEDKGSGDGAGAGAGATDAAALKEQMYALQGSEAFKDYKHRDHAATIAKIRALAEAVSKAGGK